MKLEISFCQLLRSRKPGKNYLLIVSTNKGDIHHHFNDSENYDFLAESSQEERKAYVEYYLSYILDDFMENLD